MSDDQTVTYVKAVALSYFLDVTEDWQTLVGDKWEKQFLEDVRKFAEIYYPDLEVRLLVYYLYSHFFYTRHCIRNSIYTIYFHLKL